MGWTRRLTSASLHIGKPAHRQSLHIDRLAIVPLAQPELARFERSFIGTLYRAFKLANERSNEQAV